ncbi:hypothetical protein F4820DRAFT_448880 [Hypoxylon rubiginosum]|uniref:Uncharacterized protein n=1 Tax=Hypoxylon rubiginosum TaxID=110542 RepID=A0ACB9YZB9_9PEZI|nr:hypothetical protein F4820DRAFT_448880 [Hypoxylon rubiginosum]
MAPRIIAPGEIRADFRKRTKRRRTQPADQCICSYYQYFSSMCSHPFKGKKHFKCGQKVSSATGILVFCQPNGQIPSVQIKDVLINARCKDCIKKGDRWTQLDDNGHAVDQAEGDCEEDLEAKQLRLFEGARSNLNKRGEVSSSTEESS